MKSYCHMNIHDRLEIICLLFSIKLTLLWLDLVCLVSMLPVKAKVFYLLIYQLLSHPKTLQVILKYLAIKVNSSVSFEKSNLVA